MLHKCRKQDKIQLKQIWKNSFNNKPIFATKIQKAKHLFFIRANVEQEINYLKNNKFYLNLVVPYMFIVFAPWVHWKFDKLCSKKLRCTGFLLARSVEAVQNTWCGSVEKEKKQVNILLKKHMVGWCSKYHLLATFFTALPADY